MLIHVLAIGLFLHVVWSIGFDLWKIKNDRVYEVNNDLRNAMNLLGSNVETFESTHKDWFKNGF